MPITSDPPFQPTGQQPEGIHGVVTVPIEYNDQQIRNFVAQVVSKNRLGSVSNIVYVAEPFDSTQKRIVFEVV